MDEDPARLVSWRDPSISESARIIRYRCPPSGQDTHLPAAYRTSVVRAPGACRMANILDVPIIAVVVILSAFLFVRRPDRARRAVSEVGITFVKMFVEAPTQVGIRSPHVLRRSSPRPSQPVLPRRNLARHSVDIPSVQSVGSFHTDTSLILQIGMRAVNMTTLRSRPQRSAGPRALCVQLRDTSSPRCDCEFDCTRDSRCTPKLERLQPLARLILRMSLERVCNTIHTTLRKKILQTSPGCAIHYRGAIWPSASVIGRLGPSCSWRPRWKQL